MLLRSLGHLSMVLAVGFLCLGCEKNKRKDIEGPSASGTVTYKGTPLGGGVLTLYSKNGPLPIPIGPDGSFFAVGVPPGEVKVSVETESIKNLASAGAAPVLENKEGKMPKEMQDKYRKRPGDAPDNKEPRPKYVEIPQKYARPETSGLTWKIEPGKNTKDFKLE